MSTFGDNKPNVRDDELTSLEVARVSHAGTLGEVMRTCLERMSLGQNM